MGLCVELVLEVEGERKGKQYCWKAQENQIMPKFEKKKWWLERNNKEILKNNILIKIEFLDAKGIVKWYGISNKVAF